jgi:hypothetical protein
MRVPLVMGVTEVIIPSAENFSDGGKPDFFYEIGHVS